MREHISGWVSLSAFGFNNGQMIEIENGGFEGSFNIKLVTIQNNQQTENLKDQVKSVAKEVRL